MKNPEGSMKYHIITFGCQMNERDSETLAGFLEERNYLSTDDPGDADVVLINTCSIRENADKRFFGTLGQLKRKKEAEPGYVVAVCGCMMQQQAVRDEIKAKYHWVDIVFGTHNIHEFPYLLDEATGKSRRPVIHKGEEQDVPDGMLLEVWDEGGDIVEGMPYKPMYSFKSFVNIMLGCNNFCTYCIVPYVRGRERSRKASNIVAEITKLAEGGVKEVTLLGQNVNSYMDVDEQSGERTDFTDLIYRIADIEGIERIRFMTSHPKDLSDKLIEAFRSCDKLCKYIHLPVQSGSNRVLERMNRKYTKEQYLELVKKLRKAVPHITISTDIIVGFPGESEEDFQDTLDVVNEVGFDSAFTFLFSRRPGTPAAEYADQIPEETKHERFDRLVDAVNTHSAAKNKAYEGRILDVLVEGKSKRDENALSGRSDGFKLVNFPVDNADVRAAEMAGKMVKILVTSGKTFSLDGNLL